MLIKAGRWVQQDHSDGSDPRAWTRELAAAWVAAVDQMLVGEFSQAPNTDYMRRRRGGELSPRTKAAHVWAVRRSFYDLQEWEWIERRFDPGCAFVVPRSIRALIGPDPRVIADEVWAKLMWAGLNLTVEDLPVHCAAGPCIHSSSSAPSLSCGCSPVSALTRSSACETERRAGRATAAATAGLGCACSTSRPARPGPRSPSRSTGPSATRSSAGRPSGLRSRDSRIARPASSSTCCSPTAGRRSGAKYVNQTLIPLLCRKAGVPREDVRGQITGHRARATIASQLYNAKDPMTLFELPAWLGHSSPSSTQHYARITPTKLTKAYTDAGYFARNVRTIEVLLDRDAITNGSASTGGPFEFYDLGHGFCSYSFFEQCPPGWRAPAATSTSPNPPARRS